MQHRKREGGENEARIDLHGRNVCVCVCVSAFVFDGAVDRKERNLYGRSLPGGT